MTERPPCCMCGARRATELVTELDRERYPSLAAWVTRACAWCWADMKRRNRREAA